MIRASDFAPCGTSSNASGGFTSSPSQVNCAGILPLCEKLVLESFIIIPRPLSSVRSELRSYTNQTPVKISRRTSAPTIGRVDTCCIQYQECPRRTSWGKPSTLSQDFHRIHSKGDILESGYFDNLIS